MGDQRTGAIWSGRYIRRWLLRRAIPTTLAALVASGGYALGATVTLSTKDNIQSAVNNNPAGTTFLLQPGTYRGQSVTLLKDGDSFIGQKGADLNGSRILTGWKKVSINGASYWTTPAGTPLPTPACQDVTGICCLSGGSGCTYVQDLFVNNADYTHVTSLANIVSGTWYYDFNGNDGGVRNNVYMYRGDNPGSKTVELGDWNYAFEGTALNITIQNLTVEKYAPALECGAVQALGSGWLIRNNEIRLNHGWGVKVKPAGDNVQVLTNNLHDNGEGGMSAGAINGGLFDSNTIVHNNIDGVEWAMEAGGAKFSSNNITVSNNVVHDNFGEGLFTDEGGTYNTYTKNTVYKNESNGIRYEISRYGTISNNIVYGNLGAPQIVYAGSDHGRITGNIVTDNAVGGILVYNITGTRGRAAVYPVTDTQVTGNTIIVGLVGNGSSDIPAGLIDKSTPSQPKVFSDPTNIFAHNTYQVLTMPWTLKSWDWGENGGAGNPVNWNTWVNLHPVGEKLLLK
jgi:parallel beta-helix repeat protein